MMRLYYSHNLNPRVAVAVARHLAAPVEFIRATPRHPKFEAAFRSINPNTLVPVLVEETGTLWETDAIACRLSQAVGSDFWRQGDELPEMMMWVSWANNHLTRGADPAYFERVVVPTFSSEPVLDPEEIAAGLTNFRKFAEILNAELVGRDWLVGGRLSYADFRVATALPFAAAAGLPLDGLDEIHRWHGQLMALPAWRAPFDELE